MADKKISALTAATTPLAGTEVLPIVQGGATVKVSVDNLTAGRSASFATVDTTDLEVTNLKAKDGAAAGSIADSTGVVTLASSVLTTTDINGGTIDGAIIGGASAAAGTFTSLTDSGNLNFTGTGNRITGEFSTGTISDRVAFQTSTVNGNTVITTIPNGTGVVAGFLGTSSSIDPNNSSEALFAVVGGTDVRIQAGIRGTGTYLPVTFYTGGSERVRIDTSGNVLVNTASQIASGKVSVASDGSAFTAKISGNTGVGVGLDVERTVQNGDAAYFRSTTGLAGFITITGANTCTYNQVSDYRLKENVAPMTGALAKVAALNPVTYTWKTDGSNGQGFIAHELQAVVPDCVTGEKDAVQTVDDLDVDGKKIGTKEVARYQGVDTSVLVATLVAAIQEQQALITQLQADVSALKGS